MPGTDITAGKAPGPKPMLRFPPPPHYPHEVDAETFPKVGLHEDQGK